MKKLFIFGILASFPQILSAQSERPSNPVGEALDDFGRVAGGWFLNERCKLIVGDDLATYKQDVALINVTLAKDLGNPDLLLRIQSSAKKVAYAEKFDSCGQDAKQIVQFTSTHAKKWASEIRVLRDRQ
jgi:hypothetical protein